MFSYMSTKGSQSTLENNLIEQIQSIANDIFDYQRSSVTRTQAQEMSLELSSATDEESSNIDDEFLILNNQAQHFLPSHPHDHFFQQPINRTVQPNIYKENNKQKNDEHSFRRMTKSMVSGHLLSKQPGSFSNNHFQQKNISSSNISPVPRKSEQQKQNDLSLSALHPTNHNKENILMGILSSANKANSSSKTPNKKGKFSSYASNYLSPYSTKGIRENPKSYLEKSNTQINSCAKKQKQTIQLQYIKQRLNQNIQPHISYRKEKQERNRLKNPKLSNVKSKYKEIKPIMHDYKLYADEHIYKKIKTEMGVWEEKKKQYQTLSNDQIDQNWQQFIQKEKMFLEEKKNNILSKQLQNANRQSTQFSHSPSKNVLVNGRNSMIQVTPPKMTPEDYIKKYKREKEKLKEKLEANEITNFVSKSYQNVRHFGREIFESVWGSTVSKQSQLQSLNVSNMQGQYSTIKESSSFQIDQVAKLLIESNAPSGKKTDENFFNSVGGQTYRKMKKKSKGRISSQYQNKMMAKSSVRQGNKSIGKSNSRQPKSANRQSNSFNRQSNSAKKAQGINSLSPFIKKQSYFTSKQIPPQVHEFDARQHNSPLFNEQIRTGKSKSKTKSRKMNSNQKISELLNPKYFNSINELEEYASTSREKTEMRKTFEGSKVDSREGESYLQGEEKELKFENLRKQPQKRPNREMTVAFDSKLMNKIIHDLDHMRNEIQENKKKRQYRIENYRNFSNMRKNQGSKQQANQSLPFESAVKKSKNSLNQFESRQRGNHHNEMMGRRDNHRFRDSVNEQVDQFGQVMRRGSNMFASRSVSPIENEDSIMGNGNNLSLSVIQQSGEVNGQSEIRNLQFSQFSKRMGNSSMIMVKSREEVDFIFKK